MESSGDEKEGILDPSLPRDIGPFKGSEGTNFVDDVLKGPGVSFQENFRMDKHVFFKLCDMLHARGLLRHTNKIKIEEQFALFMLITGHNLKSRALQERFGYSGETISRHFHNVLNAVMTVSLGFFQPPKESDIPSEIRDDPEFFPYFRNCVGAVGCIHIPATVSVDEQEPFRNRNGFLSQNVLAACSFDMKFRYVLAGWEGSAPDIRVLSSALTRPNKLEVPNGKYYLVDSKYTNFPGFIAPYPGVSYTHLEFGGDFHPRDSKELFNQRHSILHSFADRTFAALKARFPILTSAPSYPLATQVKLVIAACALHNYIRSEEPNDWIFKMYEQEAVLQVRDSMPLVVAAVAPQLLDIPVEEDELQHAAEVRDAIATEMWDDYIRDYGAMDGVL